jgi:hypothetical protein
MPDLNCIEDALNSTGWNRARIRLLARFIVALLCLQTVSLTRLATILPSNAKDTSVYRQLQRFLAQFTFDDQTLARLLIRIVSGTKVANTAVANTAVANTAVANTAVANNTAPPWEISLDRTDWKLGRIHLNVLLLSIVVVKVKMAFPLLWSVLEKEKKEAAGKTAGKTGKPGASNTGERVDLLGRFIGLFGAQAISCLYADREFVGVRWVEWLLTHGVSFQLRIKADTLVTNGNGEQVCADWIFRNLGLGQVQYLPGSRLVFGHRVFVGAKRIARGTEDDFLIVISDRPFEIERYTRRWGIETLFAGLKTRGFHLEETHVTDPKRLSCLIGVLAIAYCWAFAVGLWLCEMEPLRPKKHGRVQTSCLRRGLDRLRPIALLLCTHNLADKVTHKPAWLNAFQVLSCT